jgi:hypothetical protein
LAAFGGPPGGAGNRTGDGVRALGEGDADGGGVAEVPDRADGDVAGAVVGVVLPVWVVGIGRPQPASAAARMVTTTAAASTRLTGKALPS